MKNTASLASLPTHENSQESARKQIERETYEKIYASQSSFSSAELREGFLSSSEQYFCSLVRQFSPQNQLLEIGCGVGAHSIMAAHAGAQVVGIDVAQSAIDVASAEAQRLGLAEKVLFKCLDTETLSFADNSFDTIIDHEVFSSIDLAVTLPELVRVLKPGGKLVGIECIGHNPIFNFNRKVKAWRGSRTQWAVDHIMREEHFELLKRHLLLTEVKYFHLLTPYCAPLMLLPASVRANVLPAIEKLDRFVINQAPNFLKRLSFKAVFCATKPG